MSFFDFLGKLFSKKSYPYATSGRYSEDFSRLPKWQAMLFRHQQDMQNKEQRKQDNPKFKEWLGFIDQIKPKHLNRLEALATVNNWTNGVPYVNDNRNWVVDDYWATPYEFFEKGGDCEDFAATKYLALRMLGVDAKDLRLLVLDDTQKRITHAVLVVYDQKRPYVLDNQIKQVVPAATVPHYKPLYSLNEQGWWTL